MRSLLGFCVVFFSACVLSISMFVPVSLSAQPPIDTTTFYEGTIGWGPHRADPQRVYDTGSGQLVFNAYETLITWNRESYYTFQPQLATNVPDRQSETKTITGASVDYGATFSDGSICKGFTDLNAAPPNDGFSVGDVLYLNTAGKYRAWFVESMVGTYTLTLRRYWYTFNIRTSPTINFVNESGLVVDTFDIDDAEFSFERGLVQDTGPQWMYYTSMFGTFRSAAWNSIDPTRMNAIDQAHLIDDAVEKSGNDLTLNLGMPFPDNAFKQILSNPWGSIGSKSWFLSKAAAVGFGYDGDLYTLDSLGMPAWHNTTKAWHTGRSPIDRSGFLTWAGTGPYYVGVFDQPNLKIDLLKNTGYWGGWPAAGRNGSIDVYEIQFIADWTTRKTAFLSGALDTCAVPRDYMFELLNATTKEPDPTLSPYIKTIKNLSPSLLLEAIHFTFTINSTSTFIGTGSFPNGIPLNFFNNTHVRKAFAYSFNQTQDIAQRCFGEAYRQYTPLIAGLYPDYCTVTSGYDVNYALAESELKQAMFGGQSVWSTGFNLSLGYWRSSAGYPSSGTIMRDFFTTLSTYDGRTGPPFTINIAYIDWSEYLNCFMNFALPLFSFGWLADFADADNFMRQYMHSNGDLSYFQNYTLTNGWGSTHGPNYPTLNKDELIDKALVTPDGSDRAKMYADLESIYMADCPSLPLPSPTGRRWCQYWVKGWYYGYYDALFSAFYIRDYFKMDNCWYDVTGPNVAVSDGIVNMRDIMYLIIHFNAKPPVLGKPDPNWVGTYGNGGVDPYGDRTCNMRDIQGAILHFNHRKDTGVP